MNKYKLTRNLGLKIVAFIFAFFLWFIVANVDNPISRTTFSNIQVNIANDDIILQGGNVYRVVGSQTASVVVSAKRSVLESIEPSDIVATADISEMDSSTGLVPIEITIQGFEGDYESAEAVPRNLQIVTEKTNTKVFTLTVTTVGTPRDGFELGDMTVNPERVTIAGPQSTIDQISRASASISVSGISESQEIKADLVLYDDDGNSMDQNQLSNNLGDDGITVNVEVLKKKSVPMTFSVSGTPAGGYEYKGCSSEPEQVEICGNPDVVNGVDSIDIPAAALSIEGATENVVQTIDIRPYLPDGVELVEESAGDVIVTALIEQDGTRTIDVLVSSIRINNLSEDLEVSYQVDAKVSLRFEGEQSRLDVLDISNAVSVDLSPYTRPGTYTVPVLVDVPEGITLIDEASVQLTLQEKESEPQTDAEEKPSDTTAEE
ncbi:CdaR family protein [Lachnoclostridium sp. An169]|uniref:CdaR family protein n=1 Tax=Lachnoclostridium sp. An169 TaxID=1965569 RepID=UPI00174C878D|nr:CdaR family protein [Lachnoclostridium sp. An169]HJA65293.1 hypothetical protein [Candidatus Mediterraneibacter cottocaccae]